MIQNLYPTAAFRLHLCFIQFRMDHFTMDHGYRYPIGPSIISFCPVLHSVNLKFRIHSFFCNHQIQILFFCICQKRICKLPGICHRIIRYKGKDPLRLFPCNLFVILHPTGKISVSGSILFHLFQAAVYIQFLQGSFLFTHLLTKTNGGLQFLCLYFQPHFLHI